jgi:RNA polymerase sigma factor (sigma-70 family)
MTNTILTSKSIEPNIQEEQKLWQAFKRGNTNAFSQIFKKYYNDLFFYGLNILGESSKVEDVLQDLFTSIWIRREQLSDVKIIKIYLLKSFRRELMRAKKSNTKKIKQRREWKVQQTLSFTLSLEDFIIHNDHQNLKKQQLQKALQLLSKAQKEIIYLKYYNGFDDKEIAEILNIKHQSVRNTLHRALTRLRKKLVKQV